MPYIDNPRNIQHDFKCYCLDLHAYPKVSRCPSSPVLTIDSAQDLAKQLKLPLQALDDETSARTGFPTTFKSGNALSQKQIVCGKGEAVQREFPSAFKQPRDQHDHDKFIDRVGSSSVFFLLLLIVGYIVWKRWADRDHASVVANDDKVYPQKMVVSDTYSK